MVQLKLSDCSIEDYVNIMVMTSLKMKKAGLKSDNEVVASFMLAGLPDDFKPLLVIAVEHFSTKLTTDAVKALLLRLLEYC